MKKFAVVAISLALLTVSLSACGEKAAEQSHLPDIDPMEAYAAMETKGGFDFVPFETERNEDLEKLITKTYLIPEEYAADTYYFYNYIDLDQDGTDEIICALRGDYVSGVGGDAGLIVKQTDEGMEAYLEMFLVRTPIVLANHATGGSRDLVVPHYTPDGILGYKGMKYEKTSGDYYNVAAGEDTANLSGISGTAYLCGDMEAMIENGTALSLG